MYCSNCGKEVNDEWMICPYCKTKLKESTCTQSEIQPEKREISSSPEKHNDFKGRIIKEKSFWMYVFLGVVTFGIYDIYLMWNVVEDINAICEEDHKKSPNWIVVCLLSLLTFGIYGIYWIYTQGKRLYEIAPRYSVDVKENGMSYILWQLLLPGLGSLVARYKLFKNINLLAYFYNKHATTNQELRTQRITTGQIIALIIGIIVKVLFYVLLIMFLWTFIFFGALGEAIYDDAMDEQFIESESEYWQYEETEVMDITESETETILVTETESKTVQTKKTNQQMDVEELIGKTKEEVREFGFVADKNDIGDEKDSVWVAYDENDKVRTIIISEDDTQMYAFHGVYLGMQQEEAKTLFADEYPVLEEYDREFVRYNDKIRTVVTCDVENGSVTGIVFWQYTQEEWNELWAEVDKSQSKLTDLQNESENIDEIETPVVVDSESYDHVSFEWNGVYQDEETGMVLYIMQEREDTVSFQCYNADGTLYAQRDNCLAKENYIDGIYWFIAKNVDGTLSMSSGAGGLWGDFEQVDPYKIIENQIETESVFETEDLATMTIGEYLEKCMEVTTEDLARNPEAYIGKDIVLEGSFTMILDSPMIGMFSAAGGVEVNYAADAVDLDGNPIGKIVNGDYGYAAGVFNGMDNLGNMSMDALVVIITE